MAVRCALTPGTATLTVVGTSKEPVTPATTSRRCDRWSTSFNAIRARLPASPCSRIENRLDGSTTPGTGRTSNQLAILAVEMAAPRPTASVATTAAEKTGCRRTSRAASAASRAIARSAVKPRASRQASLLCALPRAPAARRRASSAATPRAIHSAADCSRWNAISSSSSRSAAFCLKNDLKRMRAALSQRSNGIDHLSARRTTRVMAFDSRSQSALSRASRCRPARVSV